MGQNMFEDVIDVFIAEIIEDDQNHNGDRFCFQEDGTPLHTMLLPSENI